MSPSPAMPKLCNKVSGECAGANRRDRQQRRAQHEQLEQLSESEGQHHFTQRPSTSI